MLWLTDTIEAQHINSADVASSTRSSLQKPALHCRLLGHMDLLLLESATVGVCSTAAASALIDASYVHRRAITLDHGAATDAQHQPRFLDVLRAWQHAPVAGALVQTFARKLIAWVAGTNLQRWRAR